MASTRSKIINAATNLFNEMGYKNVSLRNIADAAGTTIGNLTYHFPKKEDLVSSIQLDLYADFLSISINETEDELLFKEVLDSFLLMDKNRNMNIFFYENIVELCVESEKVSENVESFRYEVYIFYLKCFAKLQEHGIFRSDISKEHLKILTYSISNLVYIWRQNKTIYYDKKIQRVELADALTNLIYPYLSQKGIDIYTTIKKSG